MNALSIIAVVLATAATASARIVPDAGVLAAFQSGTPLTQAQLSLFEKQTCSTGCYSGLLVMASVVAIVSCMLVCCFTWPAVELHSRQEKRAAAAKRKREREEEAAALEAGGDEEEEEPKKAGHH